MYDIYNTYYKLIMEDQQKQQQQQQQLQKNKQINTNDIKKPIKKKQGQGQADLKFSVDLATEFSNTVNQFTLTCTKIVEDRMVDKETSDKVYNLMGKIKDLLDAASKTE